MATKLSDVLEQESSGIMFPFRTNVKPVKTEQQVYTPTDGIMNVTGTQYEGPSATITYGSEEQGFPRQLKEIEKGLLPRFDQSQFPDAGKGKVETTTTPTTQPVEPDKAIMDPCPPGFKLIDGVCQPIQQQPQQDRGGGGKTFTGPKISKEGIIEGYKPALSRAEGSINAGALNSIAMKRLEEEHGAEFASKVGLLNQKYRNRGVQISAEGLSPNDPEIKRLQSVYGQERVDEDYTLSADGKYYRIVATSPKPSELLADAVGAAGDILEGATTKGTGFIGAAKDLADELGKYLEGESKKSDTSDTTDTTVTKDGPTAPPNVQEDTKTDTPTLTPKDLGGIDKISDTVRTFSQDFGTLNNTITKELEYQQTMSNELQKLLDRKFPPQMAQSQQKKLHDSKIKEVRDKISESRVKQNIAKAESERKEKQMQEELSNSKESTMTIKGSNFTVHTNDKGKIVGYSKPGSNIVNMAGMPPVGPGQQIKTKSKSNRFTKRAAPTKTKLTGGKLKGTMGFTRGK
jgi:hypothetical protein